MRFERRKLADLRPAEYNPRKQLTPEDPEYQSIRRSIEEFGYADPIVINSDGTIIKGHQRRTVMLDLGMEEAEVIVLDIEDKAKEKALNIALNKITGQWDNVLLRDVLQGLDLEGYDFSASGFTQEDLSDLIELTSIPDEAHDDDFDPDAASGEIEEPVSRPGTVWRLGRHRLMCGDATDPEDVAILLGREKLDLIVTDPPYNVDYDEKDTGLERVGKRSKTRKSSEITNDRLSDSDFYDFLVSSFRNIEEALRPGGAAYVFHADSKGLDFRQAFQDAGLDLKEVLIWEKNNFVLGRQDYQWRHEPILYGWKPGAAHYFVKDRTQDTVFLEEEVDLKKLKKTELLQILERILQDNEHLTTVHFEAKPMSSQLHPTMKPVSLIGRFIANSSRPGWTVGDFFGGSGSTLIAAEQLGRTSYLMEIAPRNVDVIVRRWEEYTGEQAELIEP